MAAFLHRRRIERYAQLLDGTPGGRRQHSRDTVDDRLTELITAHQRLAAERAAFEANVNIDAGRRMQIREAIMSDPDLLGIAAAARASAVTGLHPLVPVRSAGTAVATAPDAVSDIDDAVIARARVTAARNSGPPTREFAAVRRRGRFAVRVRARVAVLVGLAVGTLAVSGISAASSSALPGDPLYGLKRSTENAQIALTGSDVGKGKLYLELAGVRLAEAQAVLGNSTEFTSALHDMDSQTKSGAALLLGEALSHNDATSLGVVDDFVTSQLTELHRLKVDLAGTNRDRELQSEIVLEAVGVRAQSVRLALGCGLTASTGHDQFGPQPARCPK